MRNPQIVMFDPRIAALSQEILNHPKLTARIKLAQEEGAKAHSTIFYMDKEDEIPVIHTFDQAIGFLAAEVGILVHGDYDYEAICNLCDLIREKLIEKRTVVINSGESASRTESRIIMQSDYKH